MLENKILALVQQIRDKSLNGLVDWLPAGRKNTYRAQLAGFLVEIAEIPISGQDVPDYEIVILDNAEKVIERFTDVEVSAQQKSIGNTFQAFPLFRDIFISARRKASGVNEAIDSMLSFLKRKPD